MLDFLTVKTKLASGKKEVVIFPDYDVTESKDLMTRGHDFYAIWDEAKGTWSRNEYDIVRLIDKELWEFYDRYVSTHPEQQAYVTVSTLKGFTSGEWTKWKKFVSSVADNFVELDTEVTFLNQSVTKEDYVSKRLPYDICATDTPAYNTLMGRLYKPEEREKIEWAIGSVFAGDSKKIQKFLVLYGGPGTGKGTVLDLIQLLFEGYFTVFEAKALGMANNSFALEPFRINPLVAIDNDSKMDRIQDNTKLNSIVSHEYMVMNEKYKAPYPMKFNSFLFIGSNSPVQITDSKSGILRRLIDVSPTGNTFPQDEYDKLKAKLKYELGGIASHCLDIYKNRGIEYYNGYRPKNMMHATNDMYNFVEDSYDIFAEQGYVTLKSAWALYKEYCTQANVLYPFSMKVFREELKSYFKEYSDRKHFTDDTGKDINLRSVYSGFIVSNFNIAEIGIKEDEPVKKEESDPAEWLIFTECKSIEENVFWQLCGDCDAQPAKFDDEGRDSPKNYWSKVRTKLKDIDNYKLHYVKVPLNHIVIDFDIKDEDGNKSFEKNYEAAKKWPPTYAELSKSGAGIHLHYIYMGNPEDLSRVYDDNVEVKVFSGNGALRRMLTLCCNLAVAVISSGLPLKEKGGKVVDENVIRSEKHLRALITKAINKKTDLGGTKPNVDFIEHLLKEAHDQGLHYDVSDMRQAILRFASESSHHAPYCISRVDKMIFSSDEPSEAVNAERNDTIILDVEVYPNFNCVCWKFLNKGTEVFRCPFPKPDYIENLLKYKFGGFNNRAYDNHIIYAMLMGYSPEQLYKLSKRLISKESDEKGFNEARNLSEFDIHDICSKKQSLKKWEIELRIPHQEMSIPWDEPVPEEMWNTVMEYCANDVLATEAVYNARHQDYVAREILADLSGLRVNDTTRMHTTKIIFGNDKHPQLVYTDLSEMFPGYSYVINEKGKCVSNYMGEDPGEGGYVYAEPGFYGNVALLDIASMHPTSIIQLNLFGDHTQKFKDILDARLAIKHHDYEKAKKMLGGALEPYLGTDDQADALAGALKIVINSVYGFTTATFDNPFKDPRNVDNIVAKRGALFMMNLKKAVQEKGYCVAHIKTDSIKIPDATPEIIQFVMDYGKQYGYIFEHEATYEKMCLVNDAVYIAKYKDGKHAGQWTATGTQFQIPYVFKTLFSHEPIEFEDMCETKSVTTKMYLDMNEDLPEDEHNYIFVGRVGQFCPIIPGAGGGILLREKDGKYSSVVGTKGFRWLESEYVRTSGKQNDIDKRYYRKLVDTAVETISKYVEFDWFASDSPYNGEVPFREYMNEPEEELPFK